MKKFNVLSLLLSFIPLCIIIMGALIINLHLIGVYHVGKNVTFSIYVLGMLSYLIGLLVAFFGFKLLKKYKNKDTKQKE